MQVCCIHTCICDTFVRTHTRTPAHPLIAPPLPLPAVVGAAAAAPVEYQSLVASHNTYRATHHAPALNWNDTLASSTLSYLELASSRLALGGLIPCSFETIISPSGHNGYYVDEYTDQVG
jgi:hypothetical protein